MSIQRPYIRQIPVHNQRAWNFFIPEELVPKNVYMCWTHHNMMASVLLKNKYRSNMFGPVDSGSIYIHNNTTATAIAEAIDNLKDDEILLIGTSDTTSFYVGGEKLYPMTYFGVVKIEHDEDGFDLYRPKDSPMFHIAQSTGTMDKVYYGANHDTTFFIGGEYIYTGQGYPNHFALQSIKTSDKVSESGRPVYMEYQFGTEKYAGRFAFYQAKFVKEGKDVSNTVQQYLEDSGDDFDSQTYEFFWNML